MPGSALKAGARRLIFENSPRLLGISLIYVVLITIASWLSFRLPFGVILQDMVDRLAVGELPNLRVLTSGFRPMGLALALLLSLLQPILNVGFISYCLKINRKESTEFKDIFNGFLFFVKIISIFIITAVFISLWSLLFFFPGLVAAYRYRLAYYILLDDPGKSALQCISESKLLMHGRKVDLLIIDFSFLGWYFLDIIVMMTMIQFPFALPIVSIWLSPYLGLTRAAFYEDQITKVAV